MSNIPRGRCDSNESVPGFSAQERVFPEEKRLLPHTTALSVNRFMIGEKEIQLTSNPNEYQDLTRRVRVESEVSVGHGEGSVSPITSRCPSRGSTSGSTVFSALPIPQLFPLPVTNLLQSARQIVFEGGVFGTSSSASTTANGEGNASAGSPSSKKNNRTNKKHSKNMNVSKSRAKPSLSLPPSTSSSLSSEKPCLQKKPSLGRPMSSSDSDAPYFVDPGNIPPCPVPSTNISKNASNSNSKQTRDSNNSRGNDAQSTQDGEGIKTKKVVSSRKKSQTAKANKTTKVNNMPTTMKAKPRKRRRAAPSIDFAINNTTTSAIEQKVAGKGVLSTKKAKTNRKSGKGIVGNHEFQRSRDATKHEKSGSSETAKKGPRHTPDKTSLKQLQATWSAFKSHDSGLNSKDIIAILSLSNCVRLKKRKDTHFGTTASLATRRPRNDKPSSHKGDVAFDNSLSSSLIDERFSNDDIPSTALQDYFSTNRTMTLRDFVQYFQVCKRCMAKAHRVLKSDEDRERYSKKFRLWWNESSKTVIDISTKGDNYTVPIECAPIVVVRTAPSSFEGDKVRACEHFQWTWCPGFKITQNPKCVKSNRHCSCPKYLASCTFWKHKFKPGEVEKMRAQRCKRQKKSS